MAKPYSATEALFFSSILYNKRYFSIGECFQLLESVLGPLSLFEINQCPMKNYYSHEMGKVEDLERIWVLATTPMARDNLQDLKHWSLNIEQDYTNNNQRKINIDMGMVCLENTVLSTFKPYSHRPYLGCGVYIELTYLYEKGRYRALPWTYPDYQQDQVIQFFDWARSILMVKLKS